MDHVFHRDPRRVYPVAVRGEGCYVFDREGRRYLDGCGGAGVSSLGHSDPEVIAAVKAQLDRLAYTHTSFFTNEPMEALADLVIEHAPADLARVYFFSSGSESMEAALKLARQYFLEIGQPGRRRIIARRQSYHGNTLGALAAGGNVWRRQSFDPLLIDASHVSPCYAYRGRRGDETEGEYAARLALELEDEILKIGPDQVMAFVAEPVVGATLGAVPPVAGYFRAIREVCDRYGVLLILDEVMCGMGRTGTLFACEQEDVRPDLVTVGKGLGAGFQPIGALISSADIYDAVVQGSGTFQHGQTYTGHAAACAGALAVQRAILDRGLLPRVRELGKLLEQSLRERFRDHPNVGDIRGRGLFWGVEVVADRASKRPFPAEARVHARIKAAALEHGLMCYPMGGTVDGREGDHVLLAPPFVISEAQVDDLVQRLSAALDDVVPA